MTRNFLKVILRSSQTVFSFRDLILLWGGGDLKTLRSRINYYVKNGDLYHLRKGLYAKDEKYDRYEVATKIYIPSYISFETVLGAAGITFQYHGEILVASYQTRSIVCDGQRYTFKRIRPEILMNPEGIAIKKFYSIAFPERAFLDVLYLNKDYYFDNLRPINWETVYKILPIYQNKRMEKVVKRIHDSFLEELRINA